MKEVSVLGIDLAKNVFQLHGVDQHGKVALKKKLSRGQLLAFIANLPKCLIGMEACGGAHYWAREFQKHGHEVKLIPGQFVKPYVKSNKNDAADAEAICEAVSRPNMRFASIKTEDQQDIQNLHRIRERLVRSRTALANEIRGLLQEYGIIFPQGIGKLRKELPITLAGLGDKLTSLCRDTIQDLYQELLAVDEKISKSDERISAIHRHHPVAKKLSEIPGIGPLGATALIAAVGNPKVFENGRQFSAWLGLVPKQSSSGGKERLLGISKRGDVYIRKLLVHGARSSLKWVDKKEDRLSIWAKKVIERRGMNRAAVAYANKMARIAWVVMATGKDYCQQPAN
jgi:transposase